jgi:hypothetical protein
MGEKAEAARSKTEPTESDSCAMIPQTSPEAWIRASDTTAYKGAQPGGRLRQNPISLSALGGTVFFVGWIPEASPLPQSRAPL